MTDEAREWCEQHGIELDDDGQPKLATVPGPPRPCGRCGTLAESGHEVAASFGDGRTFQGVVCAGCGVVARRSLREFADGFPKG